MAITPKSEDKYVEKCSTAQSFIRTEMSTYRIGTLAKKILWLFSNENKWPIKVLKLDSLYLLCTVIKYSKLVRFQDKSKLEGNFLKFHIL